ncbi:hypothetical protein [Butyrivibrio sp. FCS014]|uniref:hypothetical protein n=1 Tax=Butyrivibrio sp. FCS014 TaxID=1408304 RepID=UPI0004642F56|nr:hypothetical protein [Butyrivibrio sp. FCS014]
MTIENVVKYLKYGFAEHRIFKDIDSFNEDCIAWLERTGNAKVHETTKKIPAEVFALEKEYLIPVSEYSFEKPVNESITYQVRKDNVVLFHRRRKFTVGFERVDCPCDQFRCSNLTHYSAWLEDSSRLSF